LHPFAAMQSMKLRVISRSFSDSFYVDPPIVEDGSFDVSNPYEA